MAPEALVAELRRSHAHVPKEPEASRRGLVAHLERPGGSLGWRPWRVALGFVLAFERPSVHSASARLEGWSQHGGSLQHLRDLRLDVLHLTGFRKERACLCLAPFLEKRNAADHPGFNRYKQILACSKSVREILMPDGVFPCCSGALQITDR